MQRLVVQEGATDKRGAARMRVQVADEPDSDDEEFIYNPLKLPMGPDGKPIPYWLYKLHGLNQVRHHRQAQPAAPHCLLCIA